MYPTLAGRFSTTAPPGKPETSFFMWGDYEVISRDWVGGDRRWNLRRVRRLNLLLSRDWVGGDRRWNLRRVRQIWICFGGSLESEQGWKTDSFLRSTQGLAEVTHHHWPTEIECNLHFEITTFKKLKETVEINSIFYLTQYIQILLFQNVISIIKLLIRYFSVFCIISKYQCAFCPYSHFNLDTKFYQKCWSIRFHKIYDEKN